MKFLFVLIFVLGCSPENKKTRSQPTQLTEKKRLIQFWRNSLKKYPYTIKKINKFYSVLNCPSKKLDLTFENESGIVVKLTKAGSR